MVQREVKKKTSIYGLVAVLSAVVLISTIYVYGAAPINFPPSQNPSVNGMRTFTSMTELKTYLSANSHNSYSYTGGPLDDIFFDRSAMPAPVPSAVQSTGILGLGGESKAANENTITSDSGYSTTNIQVSGVDEADTVKTDGQYIYTISNNQGNGIRYFSYNPDDQVPDCINIVNADPQNAKVVSKIVLDNDTEPAGLFLSSDGNRLVVLASKYQIYSYTTEGYYNTMLAPYHTNVYTYINVYDVTNKANPTLTRNFTVSGSYFNSRMIGNNVYTVVSQSAQLYNDVVTLPVLYENSKAYGTSPTNIYYADMNDSSYRTFTSFYGINIFDDQTAPTNLTVMMGGASTMYVSPSSIFVTYPTWTNAGQFTSIYRVSINGSELTFQAEGSVPGDVLNQYSMDEYSGNFRIATNWYGETQISNIYVLSPSLNITGKLEGLAPGENLHSVRFMGDKGYLVTFKRTDPLFVIDLSQPTNPKVLGELKIPGYSDYLHPYDETHLIGVGKEAVDAQEQDFAWYQGIKLSLFDVSNVNSPVQLSNYVIGDRGTDSPVLSDPKAFLFNRTKNLLVIPISLALVDNSTINQYQPKDSAYGTTVWQGAYVFSLSTNGGFTLKGTVTHLDSTSLDNQGHLISSEDYWSTQNQWITRSLYIGNTLYTISNVEVKLNSLTDLSQIGQINLQ